MSSAAAQALGAYIHHFAADTNRGANAVGDAFSNAISSVPGIIGDNVGGFVHGVMSGQAPKPAALPAKVANQQKADTKVSPAAVAAAAAGGVKAPVYTQAYLDKQPNFVDQWNASHPNDPVGAATAARGGGGGGGGPMTPLDVVRGAAMANGGLSLNQLASLSESTSRLIPPVTQKVPTQRDQAIGLGLQIAQQQAAADMAAAKQSNDPTAYRKATDDLFQRVRTLGASPNQMFDVDQAAGN